MNMTAKSCKIGKWFHHPPIPKQTSHLQFPPGCRKGKTQTDRALRRRKEPSEKVAEGTKEEKGPQLAQIAVCRRTTWGLGQKRGTRRARKPRIGAGSSTGGSGKDGSPTGIGGRKTRKASTTGNRQQRPEQPHADKSTHARTRWPNRTQPRGSAG